MFKNRREAKRFRDSLPSHRVGSTPKSKRATVRQQNEQVKRYLAGPLAPFATLLQNAHDESDRSATLDHEHLAALSHVSRSMHVSVFIQIITNQLFETISITRADASGHEIPVKLIPEFKRYVTETYAPLARQICRSLLVYGLAPLVMVPPPPMSQKRGVRALERAAFSATASGVAAPASRVDTPVLIDLGNSDHSIEIHTHNGIREYELNSDGIDPQVLDSLMVSVLHQPDASGRATGPTADAINEISRFGALQTLHLSVAEENAHPWNLLQTRHGPGQGSANGGMDVGSLFFDRESMAVNQQGEEDREVQLVELVKKINKMQTTAGDVEQTSTSVNGVKVDRTEPQFHVVPQALESATHARYATSDGLQALTAASEQLFVQLGTLYSVPRGLTIGQGSALSGAGPQDALFKSMLGTLRNSIEIALTASYNASFGTNDSVHLIPFNPKCQDLDLIQKSFASGLLDRQTAVRLTAESLGVDCSMGLHPHHAHGNGDDSRSVLALGGDGSSDAGHG